MDLIDRKAAITAIDNCECDGEDSCGQPWIYKENAVETIEMVEPLPPARPERIKGHWVNGHCDKCNGHAPFWCMASTYHESNFCQNCGAEMEVDDGHDQ